MMPARDTSHRTRPQRFKMPLTMGACSGVSILVVAWIARKQPVATDDALVFLGTWRGRFIFPSLLIPHHSICVI